MMTFNSYPSVLGTEFTATPSDINILRYLAIRYRDIATNPTMEKLKTLWRSHNSLEHNSELTIPILVYAENWYEIPEVSTLQCEAPAARNLEFHFRQLIWQFENIPDHKPLDAVVHVFKVVHNSGWGLEDMHKTVETPHGSWGFMPQILNRDDIKKLHQPELVYDEAATIRKYAAVQDAIGDIIEIRLSGIKDINFHLAMQYSGWRGLENLYTDFYDEPELIEEVLDFLTEGHLSLIDQYERLGLLDLNNDGTYQGTGGVGYIDTLPQVSSDGIVRASNMWSSAEAQELAAVSPKMHRDFLLTREAKLLSKFGLNEYGCCEPLHDKVEDVLKLPNIRRISASPWADLEKMAESVGRKAIISWKPNPAWLSGGYNMEMIQQKLDEGVKALKGCYFEILLEDLRTCDGHPERISQWVKMVRKAISANGLEA